MKRKRFTEEQIIGILKEHEAGGPVADLCRKHGVSDASIYKWKARFGGMDCSRTRAWKAGRHWMLQVTWPSASHSAGERGGKWPAHFVYRRRARMRPSKRHRKYLANYRYLVARVARELLQFVGVEKRKRKSTDFVASENRKGVS
ncbi:hypothetical protein ABIB68_007838 [Bradyrhizobium sp. F1.2.2]